MLPQPRQIRILDDATVDHIAAGEVVERPASVVKELAENSLDAGARSIAIELAEGGLTRIALEDDGYGIAFDDLPLAFERHATSKIASAADILRVETFGFRGEALAAIAAISRVRLVSRQESEEEGGRIDLDGGTLALREPAPRNRGTTVEVTDLFYNTPARRKFMKSVQAEKRACLRIVTTLALANWSIHWRLVADGQLLLDLRPATSLPGRVRDVLGASVTEHLVRFEAESGGFSVAGLASKPDWVRGNREQQYLFVNRRPVESGALYQAIAQAYRDIVPAGKHPTVIAFLQLPAGEVDVNVHPAKTEVRLLLERQVFALLRRALREGLGLDSALAGAEGASDSTQPVRSESAPTGGIAAAEADFLRRHFDSRSGAGSERPSRQRDLFRSGERSGAGDTERVFGFAIDRSVSAPVTEGREPASALHPAPFWQLHRTYIVTQIRGGLVLIDQHNSHERILYNQAQYALRERGSVPTQQLLFPVHLELSAEQIQVFGDVHDALDHLGFAIQPFGGHAVLVQGIPASLRNWNDGRLLLDILDDLAKEGRDPAHAAQDALVASFACRGAVKAGEPLTVPEMQALVDQLFATDVPLSCPHGRPTLIQFTLEELERRFGRR
jgi:DNA mismatch repair protein MutL